MVTFCQKELNTQNMDVAEFFFWWGGDDILANKEILEQEEILDL